MERFVNLIEVLTPVLVVLVTTSGAVVVAMINRIQKKLRTNHGSVSIGDAIDRLTDSVSNISSTQETLLQKVTSMEQKDSSLDTRLGCVEQHLRIAPKRSFFNRRRR